MHPFHRMHMWPFCWERHHKLDYLSKSVCTECVQTKCSCFGKWHRWDWRRSSNNRWAYERTAQSTDIYTRTNTGGKKRNAEMPLENYNVLLYVQLNSNINISWIFDLHPDSVWWHISKRDILVTKYIYRVKTLIELDQVNVRQLN